MAGTTGKLWVYVAAGFCSQAAVILLTAVISLVVPGQVPVLASLGVAVLLAGAAFACRPRTQGPILPTLDPWAFAVPVFATVTVALITRSAIALEDGDLLVRAFTLIGFLSPSLDGLTALIISGRNCGTCSPSKAARRPRRRISPI